MEIRTDIVAPLRLRSADRNLSAVVVPVPPTDPRWRERVEVAYDESQPIAAALRVAGASSWVGVATIGLAVLSAFAVAVLASVEVTARGPGALRAAEGSLPLLAEISGPVARVQVRSGERVAAGQEVLSIDATAMRASLEESTQRLHFFETSAKASNAKLDALAAERRRMLEERTELLQQRVANQTTSVERLDKRANDLERLRAQGFLSVHARDDALERLDEARRQRLSTVEELARTRAEISELNARRESERFAVAQERATASARRDAAHAVLRQTSIAAPRAGVIESVVVRAGELVQPGVVVAKIVPDAPPAKVVAFISERDRAFLAPGARARLDVHQLPVGEFGMLNGTVSRIGADLASGVELQDTLGEGHDVRGPHYRVEIELNGDAAQDRVTQFLRAGMRVEARFILRERRIITLVLEPLRKWLS